MKLLLLQFTILGLLTLLAMTAVPLSPKDALNKSGQPDDNSESRNEAAMAPQDFLNKLVGKWEGTCKTWFKPGELADESSIKGEIKPILNGKFFRHLYESEIQGKPRHGEETIAYNAVIKNYQVSWMDDFHMSYAIMFSVGDRTASGFAVTGTYDVGEGIPPWGWKTKYELIDKDHLTITAYNITPDGEEAKAVETIYKRSAPK